MSYVIDAVGVNTPEALELLADAVLNPAFNSWEVATAVKKLEGDLKALSENSQTTMLEVSKGYRWALEVVQRRFSRV